MAKKIKIKKLLILISALFLFVIIANAVPAKADEGMVNDNLAEDIGRQDEVLVQKTGLKTQKLSVVMAFIIKAVLSFLGVIFVSLVIYAGILWMTSTGNEEKISKAKKTMAAAAIGLAICLGAYAITSFVLDQAIGSNSEGSKPLPASAE